MIHTHLSFGRDIAARTAGSPLRKEFSLGVGNRARPERSQHLSTIEKGSSLIHLKPCDTSTTIVYSGKISTIIDRRVRDNEKW